VLQKGGFPGEPGRAPEARSGAHRGSPEQPCRSTSVSRHVSFPLKFREGPGSPIQRCAMRPRISLHRPRLWQDKVLSLAGQGARPIISPATEANKRERRAMTEGAHKGPDGKRWRSHLLCIPRSNMGSSVNLTPRSLTKARAGNTNTVCWSRWTRFGVPWREPIRSLRLWQILDATTGVVAKRIRCKHAPRSGSRQHAPKMVNTISRGAPKGARLGWREITRCASPSRGQHGAMHIRCRSARGDGPAPPPGVRIPVH
jgi:hypothetical protein